MSYGINSEDMVAICLLLAEGDNRSGVGEIIERAERYQEIMSDYFGTWEHDFESAFFMMEIGGPAPVRRDCDAAVWASFSARRASEGWQWYRRTQLWQWVEPMLEFDDVWFKDTETYWAQLRPERSERNLLLWNFFAADPWPDPEETLHFLASKGWEFGSLARFLSQRAFENSASLE